jgi:hypothetical protein
MSQSGSDVFIPTVGILKHNNIVDITVERRSIIFIVISNGAFTRNTEGLVIIMNTAPNFFSVCQADIYTLDVDGLV